VRVGISDAHARRKRRFQFFFQRRARKWYAGALISYPGFFLFIYSFNPPGATDSAVEEVGLCVFSLFHLRPEYVFKITSLHLNFPSHQSPDRPPSSCFLPPFVLRVAAWLQFLFSLWVFLLCRRWRSWRGAIFFPWFLLLNGVSAWSWKKRCAARICFPAFFFQIISYQMFFLAVLFTISSLPLFLTPTYLNLFLRGVLSLGSLLPIFSAFSISTPPLPPTTPTPPPPPPPPPTHTPHPPPPGCRAGRVFSIFFSFSVSQQEYRCDL